MTSDASVEGGGHIPIGSDDDLDSDRDGQHVFMGDELSGNDAAGKKVGDHHPENEWDSSFDEAFDDDDKYFRQEQSPHVFRQERDEARQRQHNRKIEKEGAGPLTQADLQGLPTDLSENWMPSDSELDIPNKHDDSCCFERGTEDLFDEDRIERCRRRGLPLPPSRQFVSAHSNTSLLFPDVPEEPDLEPGSYAGGWATDANSKFDVKMKEEELNGQHYKRPEWAPFGPFQIPREVVSDIEDNLRRMQLNEWRREFDKRGPLPSRRRYAVEDLPGEYMHPKDSGPWRGPWLPLSFYPKTNKTWNTTAIICDGWKSFFKAFPEVFLLRQFNFYRRPYVRYSPALSFVTALSQLPENMQPGAAFRKAKAKELKERGPVRVFHVPPAETVHLYLVGAGIKERDSFESGGFQMLAGAFPDVYRWEIEFIGPEADLCGSLPYSPGKFQTLVYPDTWNRYAEEDIGGYPDFHPDSQTDDLGEPQAKHEREDWQVKVKSHFVIGCWTGMGVIAESWMESLPSLLNSNMPMCLLSYDMYEVEGERRLISSLGGQELRCSSNANDDGDGDCGGVVSCYNVSSTSSIFRDLFARGEEAEEEAANLPGDPWLNMTQIKQYYLDHYYESASDHTGVDAATSSDGRPKNLQPGDVIRNIRCGCCGEKVGEIQLEPYPRPEPDIEEFRLQREYRRIWKKCGCIGENGGRIYTDKEVMAKLQETYDPIMAKQAFKYIKEGELEPTAAPTPPPTTDRWFDEEISNVQPSPIWPGAQEVLELSHANFDTRSSPPPTALPAAGSAKSDGSRGRLRRRARRLLRHSMKARALREGMEQGVPLRCGKKFDPEDESYEAKEEARTAYLNRWNRTFDVDVPPGGYGWWIRGSNYTKREMERLALAGLEASRRAGGSNLGAILDGIERSKQEQTKESMQTVHGRPRIRDQRRRWVHPPNGRPRWVGIDLLQAQAKKLQFRELQEDYGRIKS